jgi:hypothetical protein
MASRKQPYLPLYVQDFLTDEKLMECSAEATGVYIRLMCIMHKSEEYGTFLLKQNINQEATLDDFAHKLVRFMPYEFEVIHRALHQLIDLEVIAMENCKLLQARMIRDNNLSIVRADAGSKGGKQTQVALAKVRRKVEAKPENENEIDICIEYWNNSRLSSVVSLSSKRREKLKQRFKSEHFKANWRAAIDKLNNSSFCLGQNARNWKATLDWFIDNDNNYLKALEGKYDDQKKGTFAKIWEES